MSDKPESERDLDGRLDALTHHCDPDPVVWSAIEARLDRENQAETHRAPPSARRRGWAAGLAFAASLTGALALGLALLQSPGGPGGSAPVARAFQMEQTAMRAVAPEPLPALLPDAPESLMAAWAENQAAIDELERALQRDPENRLLLEFLAQARLRQARLVQHGISRPQTRSIDL